MAQWSGELPALAEDRSLIASTHTELLKPGCNSIPGDATPSFGLHRHLHTYGTQIHIIKK